MNTFVKPFPYIRKPNGQVRYGVATYVAGRNGDSSCFKRLTGPLEWTEAVIQAQQIRDAHALQLINATMPDEAPW